MLRKSSNAGGRCSRGIVSEGGANAGFGAGCTSELLTGGSGNCSEGEGYWGEGWGFCPETAGLVCIDGTGVCGVNSGSGGLEVDCGDAETWGVFAES